MILVVQQGWFDGPLTLVPRRIHWHRKLSDIAALKLADLAHPLLVDFVDANYGVHRQVSPFHILELRLDFFFGRINDQRRPLAEYQLLDLDESEHFAVTYAPGIDLIDLPLAHEDNFVEVFLAHLECY